MKKLIYCLVAIALIACNDKKGDDFVVQPGTYAFKQSEQIADDRLYQRAVLLLCGLKPKLVAGKQQVYDPLILHIFTPF